MSRLTTYHYAVMTKDQADAHASETLYGLRTSDDGSTVIAKLPTTMTIAGAEMLALNPLFKYIDDNPALWSDPTA